MKEMLTLAVILQTFFKILFNFWKVPVTKESTYVWVWRLLEARAVTALNRQTLFMSIKTQSD